MNFPFIVSLLCIQSNCVLTGRKDGTCSNIRSLKDHLKRCWCNLPQTYLSPLNISSFHFSPWLEISLTFLVTEKQSLLRRVWPLEGSVIIVIHTAGHVGCAPLYHRHILSDGELTLATCGIVKQSLRSLFQQEAVLKCMVVTFFIRFFFFQSNLTSKFKLHHNNPQLQHSPQNIIKRISQLSMTAVTFSGNNNSRC